MKCRQSLTSVMVKSRGHSNGNLRNAHGLRQQENERTHSRRDIQSLCKDGLLDMAVKLMKQQGSKITMGGISSLLKLCNIKKSLHHAKLIHSHITQHCPHAITSLNEHLVFTLVKCGDLEAGIGLFQNLTHRTVFSWTAAISGYIDNGMFQSAIRLYCDMLTADTQPNDYTLTCLIKACGNFADVQCGRLLHVHALDLGYHTHVTVGTSLINMYAKCGHVTESENLFFGLPQHDVVSWTTMLSVLVENGYEHKVMETYESLCHGVIPNERTIAVALEGCCILLEKEKTFMAKNKTGFINNATVYIGHRFHVEALWRGFESNIFVGNNLLKMYWKSGSIVDAERVFSMLTSHNPVSWTTMLSLFVDQNKAEEALKLYRQMKEQGADIDEKTLLITIRACSVFAANENATPGKNQPSKLISFQIGQALHSAAKRKGLESDVFIGNALLYLYLKCERFREAEDTFQRLDKRDTISWTVMISLYAENNRAEKGLQLYKLMHEEGILPDERTIISAIQACCELLETEEWHLKPAKQESCREIGKALHNDALMRGLDFDIHLCSKLVQMYGKCGCIFDAEYSFHASAHHDFASFNVMLVAYIEQGFGDKALYLFKEMQETEMMVDDSAYACALQACSETWSLRFCRHIHHSILCIRNDVNLLLSTSLIHTYGSCAAAADAHAVFKLVSAPDVVVWNSLMDAYTQCGYFMETLNKFREMEIANVSPNAVTFLSLLSACCQTGLVDKGVEIFEAMSTKHKLNPSIEHYGCLIDLFGRAGEFGKLEDLLARMSIQPDVAVYLGVLGACREYGNRYLGKHLFVNLI